VPLDSRETRWGTGTVLAVQVSSDAATAEITYEVPDDSAAARLFAAMFPGVDAPQLHL
jgi:hypothetical protein